ncbi:variant surface glycoprotein (VSG, atypical), putative [Trypanosoma brucei brucei TREU927]|uniref:Variant surface glycoprotein (VSG, atypical), putative n=1 Tax=Trypanosoma brucei brucei (strain 927/4 GUTat10.1) TaxID=185431 RepID=Q580P5_TRYB2|nr:variant surface glycoprotein (VSG, atypical), putative [Trypanosoma brucei brucei TREU927]XP_844688.1 variant surface glycoprotein (VSG, atypical), putative [Trypanosoma brucei brucei TREU927]AAX79138.1 variant surface glycoprotein (VSG, atypical), putative [Trypanosoma brucei]AAX79139.1 variant surface glycoprotein (VSG, atypical), putative [Trypanosoma brucei]AAZ11128.1 variant surface glycoprotein (VSG, atypical), putative [Trypanosoma brucei brucei TREU927]AAZ11129.1 variant surface gly
MESRPDTKGMCHATVAATVPVLFMTLMRCGMAQTVTEPSSDKVTNLCTEAKYTEYLASRIVAVAERQEREISDMQIYSEAWNLLAASTNQTDKRAATYALATYMSTAAETARRAHAGKYKAAVATAKLLHRRSALTRTLLTMRIRGKTIVGISKEANGIGICPGEATPTLSGDSSCAHRTNDSNQPEGIAVNLKAATHIKLLNSSALRPRGLTHLVEIKETKWPASREALVERCGGLLGGDHYVKFEASTTGEDSKIIVEPIKIFEGDDAEKNCAVVQKESMKSEKDNDLLINKICTYITILDPQIITISSLTPAMLANTSTVQMAFKSFVHAATGKAPSDGEIELQLKSLYGGDKQNFTRDFVKILWTKNVTYHTGAGFKTETLLDAVRNKNAQRALIYLEDQRPAEESKQTQTDESEINGPVCGGEGQEECKLDEKKDPEKPNGTQMRKWPKALQWMITRQGGNCKTIQQEDCKEDCTWDEGACDGAVGISASMNISLFMAFLLLA